MLHSTGGFVTPGGGGTSTLWVNSDSLPQAGVTAVLLSKTSLSNLGAQNKGGVIGAITVTGAQTIPVVIGGTDAAKFAVTNGGMVPCNLVAAKDIPAGSYSITLSAT